MGSGWLYLDLRKKTQSKGKGKFQEYVQEGKDSKTNRDVADGKKKSFAPSSIVFNSKIDGNKADVSSLSTGNKAMSGDLSSIVFNSKADEEKSKVLVNPKEPQKILDKDISSTVKESGPKYGIQTTMDVEVIGPNRLRFIEEREVPDGSAKPIFGSSMSKKLEDKSDHVMHDEEHEQMLELLDQTLKIQPSPVDDMGEGNRNSSSDSGSDMLEDPAGPDFCDSGHTPPG
ncbi:Ca2+-independent phospholipase A2 [Sesbania bispinosa]|nr:Ca2+-independent phospholipase A2 [Sesbania bispinosa]